MSVSIQEESCASREGKCTKSGSALKWGPDVKMKCLGSLLHGRSACGKTGTPCLYLMGEHTHSKYLSSIQKRKLAGLRIKMVSG